MNANLFKAKNFPVIGNFTSNHNHYCPVARRIARNPRLAKLLDHNQKITCKIIIQIA